jgi:hypothetical protein
MELTSRVQLAAALLALTGAACARAIGGEYGEPALSVRQFPALDSALVGHHGAWVTVWAQPEPAPGPRTMPPPMVGFRGHLAGLDGGWLHLLRDQGDTLRIGKDYVRRVQLVRSASRNRWIGGLVGAVGFGLAGWVFTRDERPGSTAGQLGIVAGSVVVGAGLGAVLVPGSRLSGQLYPPPPHSARVTP